MKWLLLLSTCNFRQTLHGELFLLPAGGEALRQVNDAFEEVNQLVGTVDPDTLAKLEKISINLEKQI